MSGLEQLAERRVSLRRHRIDAARLAQLVERGIDLSFLLEDRTEHVVRVGIIGPADDCLLEQRHGLVGSPGLP